MNIKVHQNSLYYKNYEQVKNNSSVISDIKSDEFIRSNNNKDISFNGLFSFFSKKTHSGFQYTQEDEEASDFAKNIAKSIKEAGELDPGQANMHPSHYKCIMTPMEIREMLPSLSYENFNAESKENVEKGVYCVDLDYQTNYSSGIENLSTIMNNVVQYANEYNERTGKKFVFAVTDRDTLEGVKHIVKMVGNDPEKYKNVKLITGLKLSYAHKAPNSQIGYENSDMLIYGVNPFSKNLNDYIDRTIDSRKSMIVDFITDVYKLYPEYLYRVLEFAEQNNIKYRKSYGVSNLYWRVREYTETKGDVSMKSLEDMDPQELRRDVENIMSNLNQLILGSNPDYRIGLNTNLEIKDEDLNKRIKEIFGKYSTHVDETKGNVVSSAENLYEKMIEHLNREPEKPVLAFASPYYFSHYYENQNPDRYENVVNFMLELKKKSKGMLIAFESKSPGYDLDRYLSEDTIRTFNEYIRRRTKLYEVGGSFAKKVNI